MQRITLVSIGLILFQIAYPQLIINNPEYGDTNAPYKIPYRIEITDTTTVISFHVTYRPGKVILISDSTYIQAESSNKRLYIISSSGIKINEKKAFPPTGELEFKLVFPHLDIYSAHSFRYIEPVLGGRGKWYINDIQIKF